MANGDGTYNNPIVVDGLIKKDGKIYKLNTGNTKNCVKSVNNIKPDDNGNVVVPELDKTDIENSITEIKKKNAEQDTALSQAKQELSDKCDTTLSTAKTYANSKVDDALSQAKTDASQKYLPLAGGKLSGMTIARTVDDSCINIYSGTQPKGACLIMSGKDRPTWAGQFHLLSTDDTHEYRLIGKPTGELTWADRHLVRTVGNCLADANGNCNVGVITLSATSETAIAYRFSNGLIIQCARISGNQGQSFGTINWPIAFSDTNYFVFATSEDPDENLTFQLANVSYLNKTVTSCRIGHTMISHSGMSASFFNGGWISALAIGV